MTLQLSTAEGFRQRHQPLPDTVDVGQFFRLLRRRALTILLLTGLAGGAALLHVLFANLEFTAQGALYLGDTPNGGNNSASNLNLSDYSAQNDVETQIELITSGALIEQAVLETGLNANIRPANTPKLTYWRWRVFLHGSTQAFVPGDDALQVINATTPGKYRLVTGPGNSYKLYRRGGLFSGESLVLHGVLGQPATGNGVSLTVRPANPALRDAGNFKFKPGQSFDLDVVAPDALANGLLAGALSVNAGGSPMQPTHLAFLQFRWSDPYQAQLFVNQVMHDYIATQLAWKTESASATESFVTGQLANVSKQLTQANKSLSAYQAKTGIVDPAQNAQAAITQMTQLRTQRAALDLQRQALAQLKSSLDSKSAVNPYLISQTNDDVLSALTNSLSQAQVKLRQLEVQYTRQAPDMQVQEAQVAELKTAIRDLVNNDLKAADQKLASLDRMIGQYHDEIEAEPAEALKVGTLKRSADRLGQLYELLSEKAEQAQISKAATIIATRIVTPAQMPLGPTSPKAAITVIAGALAGFIAGMALVLAQRGLSGRFESEEQIRLAAALPVYGAVPRLAQGTGEGKLFGPARLNPFSEAFRLIKRNIYRSTAPGRCATLLVISAAKEDGKTTVATNLAKTLADDGKRVLLVDCDLHLSRVQTMPRFEGARGLTDWLVRQERPLFSRWPGEQFYVLPAGTIRAAGGEPMSEASLEIVFRALAQEFDFLVLDSPPLPIVSDGLTLGQFADLILSVVSVGHTMRRAFERHNELIEALDKPHGIIINGAEEMNYAGADAYFMGRDIKRGGKFTGWFRV